MERFWRAEFTHVQMHLLDHIFIAIPIKSSSCGIRPVYFIQMAIDCKLMHNLCRGTATTKRNHCIIGMPLKSKRNRMHNQTNQISTSGESLKLPTRTSVQSTKQTNKQFYKVRKSSIVSNVISIPLFCCCLLHQIRRRKKNDYNK